MTQTLLPPRQMLTLSAPDAFGNTTFCDDIRMEVNGKLTLVGCYSTELYATSNFPIIIPKLCLAINYWQRKGLLILPVVFWVFLPGDSEEKASIEFGTTEQLTPEMLEQRLDRPIEPGIEPPEYSVFSAQVALANLAVAQPGSIKVRDRRGEQLVRLGSLRIRSVPALSPSQEPQALALSLPAP